MKLTTKGRYAVTALLDLALMQDKGPITIPEIAQRHHLSTSYLERLAAQLRKHGLLISVRGAHGGFLLGREPGLISIAEIVTAVEEQLDSTQCQGRANCREGGMCLTHHLWDSLNQVILEYLQNITLQDLLEMPGIAKLSETFYLPTRISLNASSVQETSHD